MVKGRFLEIYTYFDVMVDSFNIFIARTTSEPESMNISITTIISGTPAFALATACVKIK